MFEHARGVEEQARGSTAAGFALGALLGVVGVLLSRLGMPLTRSGALLGFAIRLALLGLLWLTSGVGELWSALTSPPPPMSVPACACSVQVPLGMDRVRDLSPGAALQLADYERGLFLVDHATHRVDMWPMSAAAFASYHRELALINPAAAQRPLAPVEPTEIGGMPAATMSFVSEMEGVEDEVYMLYAAVRSPSRLHLLVGWTPMALRDQHEDTLRALMWSFRSLESNPGPGWLMDLSDSLADTHAGATPTPGPPPEALELAGPPPAGMRAIRYPAPLGPSFAWLSPAPRDDALRPALLWLHSGFGGVPAIEAEDDGPLRAFLDAGFVVMAPTWRGELDNPGDYEQLWGELDDLHAARAHLAELPYVDATRIYVAGLDEGGSLALLAATSGLPGRAFLALGGAPAVTTDPEDFNPYDKEQNLQAKARSAIAHTPAIRSPTVYINQRDDPLLPQALAMQAIAEEHQAPFRALHATELNQDNIPRLLQGLAAHLAADTAPGERLQVSQSDLDAWLQTP